ncbi:MAG TPA: hypothetical protein VE174_05035 [Actinomycetota bacterium]|nr:hypothetical protein [Actinomycetota bacterium]
MAEERQGRFKADGKWWYRSGEKLLVFEDGEWVRAPEGAAPAVPAPVEEARSDAAPGIRFGPLIGAGAVGLSAVLAWISGIDSASSFEVPLSFLFSGDQAVESGFDLGWVLIALAVVGIALCFRPDASLARRVCGGVAILISVLFTIQAARALSAFGAEASAVFDVLGVGVFLMLGGGLVLAIDR